MKTPRDIFKAALRKTGHTRPDIATCAGISPRSLENLLSGAENRRGRQNVTNLLGITIWKGMPPTERFFIFDSDVEIDCSGCIEGEKCAKETAAELGECAQRTGSIIRFLRPVAVRLDVGPGKDLSAAARTQTRGRLTPSNCKYPPPRGGAPSLAHKAGSFSK